MGRKKKDKNNIDQEQIDLIPVESQQEETEVDTQPDAEPENPEATAEDRMRRSRQNRRRSVRSTRMLMTIHTSR